MTCDVAEHYRRFKLEELVDVIHWHQRAGTFKEDPAAPLAVAEMARARIAELEQNEREGQK